MTLLPPSDLDPVQPDEARLIQKIVDLQLAVHQSGGARTLREQHPKHQGLCEGRFVVEPDLPPDLKVGLFAQPGDYPAWVRFSNGRGHDDARKSVRGLALKIKGIDHLGRSEHDFLLIDNPVFFIKDLQDYVDLFQAQKDNKGGFPRGFVFPGLNPLNWRLGGISRILAATHHRGSLVGIQYWSTTPYRFGNRAIKFSLRPHDSNGGDPPAGKTQDFLRERLVEHFKTKPATFDFLVQFQTDRKSTPVDDPTVNWDDASPAPEWRKVATLSLPLQNPATPERLRLAEDMAFTPWNALAEHEPLGAINRARRATYEALARDRFDADGRPGPASPTAV